MFRRGYQIQPQPSNSFGEESETNPHDKKSGVIRQHLKDFNNKEWGFAIVRCDYSSQERWEKFFSFVKEDAKDYLDSSTDVWEALAWTVIEDPALDGADFTEASNRFGQWAIRDLEIMEAEEKGTEVTGEPTTSEDRDPESDKPVWMEYFDRSDLPRHHFFIYVDKEVIDSVVDIPDPTTPRDIPGAYFIKLCCQYFIMQRVDRKATRKVRQAKRAAGVELTDRELEDEEEMDDAGLEYEDSDEECGDYQRHHLQKFKASDIADLYAVMAEDFNIWPDFTHLYGQDKTSAVKERPRNRVPRQLQSTDPTVITLALVPHRDIHLPRIYPKGAVLAADPILTYTASVLGSYDAELIDSHIERVSGQQFGQVSAGKLTLNGPLHRVIIDEDVIKLHVVENETEGSLKDCKTGRTLDLYLDTSENRDLSGLSSWMQSTQSSKIWLFQIARKAFLVVVPVARKEADLVFRRAGTAFQLRKLKLRVPFWEFDHTEIATITIE